MVGGSEEHARGHLRRFIGVDLGGGRGKTTAVARLELNEGDEGPELVVAEAKLRQGHRGTGPAEDDAGAETFFRDATLAQYLKRWVDPQTVVAVDAPLTLPPCLRCQLPCPGVEACGVPVVMWMRRHAAALSHRRRRDRDKPLVTPYTQRATELVLDNVGLQPREAMGQGTGPLAARAQYVRRLLSPRLRLHENLIEVHPRATLRRLFGEKRERQARRGVAPNVRELRKRMLVEMGEGLRFRYVWPELVVRNMHVFHAVVSGFTAHLWAVQRWTPAGQLAPPPRHGDTGPTVAEAAVRDLGFGWLEDGWIWTPPARANADVGRPRDAGGFGS